jgi:hypothetical protein
MGWRRKNRHAAGTKQPRIYLLGRVGRRGNKSSKRRLSCDSRKREVRDDSFRSLQSLPMGAPLAGEPHPIRFRVLLFDSFARGYILGLDAGVPRTRGGLWACPGTNRPSAASGFNRWRAGN